MKATRAGGGLMFFGFVLFDRTILETLGAMSEITDAYLEKV